MDPDTTFAQFVSAVADNDRETAVARLEQLHEWYCRGGFRAKFPENRVIPVGFIDHMLGMLKEEY